MSKMEVHHRHRFKEEFSHSSIILEPNGEFDLTLAALHYSSPAQKIRAGQCRTES